MLQFKLISQLAIFKAQIERHHKTKVKKIDIFFLEFTRRIVAHSRLRLVYFGRLESPITV